MRVLERLLSRDLPTRQAAAFEEAGTSPAAVLAAMTADAELQSLLKEPVVRQALSQIRANPAIGMARWGGDPLVSRALDLLEAALSSQQQVVDVAAEAVQQQQQQQQRGGLADSSNSSSSGVGGGGGGGSNDS
jgi:hypothetical protein